MLDVALFSGGRGSAKIIPELLKWDSVKLSVILNGYDDGKSTGEIRKFFKMLGPSDIRKNQELLMSKTNVYYEGLKKLFQFRFPLNMPNMECKNEIWSFINGENTIAGVPFADDFNNWLAKKLLKQFLLFLEVYEKLSDDEFNFSDCSLANCLYAGAYELLGKNFDATIDFFNVILHVKGEVIPTNLQNKKLMAIRENGEVLYNEAQIVEIRSSNRIRDIFLVDDPPIKSVFDKHYTTIEERHRQLKRLESRVFASEKTLGAIRSADIIVYSPGTQHSSLYPSYMTLGIPECIFNNKKALKVFIANIGEDYEIPDYRSDELVKGAYKYLTKNSRFDLPLPSLIDAVLVNIHRSKDKESIRYIKNDRNLLESLGVKIIYDNFEDLFDLGKHDPGVTVTTILDLYYSAFYRKILHETN